MNPRTLLACVVCAGVAFTLALGASSCCGHIKTSHVPLGSDKQRPETQEVIVFHTESDVKRPYEKVALIRVADQGLAGGVMHARCRAKNLGADAIIVQSMTESHHFHLPIIQSGYASAFQALAIVFTDDKTGGQSDSATDQP